MHIDTSARKLLIGCGWLIRHNSDGSQKIPEARINNLKTISTTGHVILNGIKMRIKLYEDRQYVANIITRCAKDRATCKCFGKSEVLSNLPLEIEM